MQRIVGVSGGLFAGLLATKRPIVHSEEKVAPPKYPWNHLGLFSSYDHARYFSISNFMPLNASRVVFDGDTRFTRKFVQAAIA